MHQLYHVVAYHHHHVEPVWRGKVYTTSPRNARLNAVLDGCPAWADTVLATPDTPVCKREVLQAKPRPNTPPRFGLVG